MYCIVITFTWLCWWYNIIRKKLLLLDLLIRKYYSVITELSLSIGIPNHVVYVARGKIIVTLSFIELVDTLGCRRLHSYTILTSDWFISKSLYGGAEPHLLPGSFLTTYPYPILLPVHCLCSYNMFEKYFNYLMKMFGKYLINKNVYLNYVF